MTNQDIQKQIDLMRKIIKDLKQEKFIKQDWIEREKEQMKEQYQDLEMIRDWENRIKEIDLEIDVLENTGQGLIRELEAEAQAE